MVFVTVGTHEQQFDRLIEKIDQLVKNEKIQERVFIQTGFSTYKPQYCEYQKMLSCLQMEEFQKEARIVITHGGPSSFIEVLRQGKIPIVVPRRKEFGEHVNNHQVDFCNRVSQTQKNIIVVNDISELQSAIDRYDILRENMKNNTMNNNREFNEQFEHIVNSMGIEQ